MAAVGVSVGVEEKLVELCTALPRDCVVVEIGSHEGYSAHVIATIILPKGGRLYCVDPYQGNQAQGQPDYVGARDTERMGRFVDGFHPDEKVILMLGHSVNVAPIIADNFVDLIFIDADHRYSFASQDIELWWPKLKIGGIMCGDDYEGPEWDEEFIEQDYVGNQHHGACKAVTELFAENTSAS